jgi:hypothetical protein
VVDNCEHALDAAAAVIEAILVRTTTVTVTLLPGGLELAASTSGRSRRSMSRPCRVGGGGVVRGTQAVVAAFYRTMTSMEPR